MQNLEVIHENNDYLVVNKRAGLISEQSAYEDVTVQDQVFNHLLKSKPKPFVGVIHRLDRVTSGILIFAKKKSVLDIAKELSELSELARSGKIRINDLEGGTFTVSSLGGFGGTGFTPIINAPEVAILGVGRAEKKQIFIENKYESRTILPISLSYDHRIIDGAEGARFCVHLKESLGKDFAYKLAV